MVVTHVPGKDTHPKPRNWHTPLNLAAIDAADHIIKAVNLVACLLCGDPSRRPEARDKATVADAITSLKHRAAARAAQPGWDALAMEVTEILAQAVAIATSVVDPPTRTYTCLACGAPLESDGGSLTCPNCGPLVAPVVVTLEQAGLILRRSLAAVRKAAQRHKTQPADDAYPHRYRLDDLAALFDSTTTPQGEPPRREASTLTIPI